MSAFEGSSWQQVQEEKEAQERRAAAERIRAEMMGVRALAGPRTLDVVVREINDKIRTIEAAKAATVRLAELREEFARLTSDIEARVAAARVLG